MNERARRELGWQPRHDFHSMLARLQRGEGLHSELTLAVGTKPYHPQEFEGGYYPIDSPPKD